MPGDSGDLGDFVPRRWRNRFVRRSGRLPLLLDRVIGLEVEEIVCYPLQEFCVFRPVTTFFDGLSQ